MRLNKLSHSLTQLRVRLLGLLYRFLVRPLLFLKDPEESHEGTIASTAKVWHASWGPPLCRWLFYGPGYGEEYTPPCDLRFHHRVAANPLGMAAGFDKNAHLGPALAALGFGFVEVGTVTPQPQAGNVKPRLERIPERSALLNRMGFNNDGAQIIAARLQQWRHAILDQRLAIPVGVNIGKNKTTADDLAAQDYRFCLDHFKNIADYFVINVSSPNTPGLRDLQSLDFLRTVVDAARALSITQPLFVKLAPEVDTALLKDLATLMTPTSPLKGLVLTNTIKTDRGGISGRPLKNQSLALLRQARLILPTEATIISVGGIETGSDLIERLRAGAQGAQIYTALVYGGPTLPGEILYSAARWMQKRGVRNWAALRER
jgi:dihydroorotate dehydrogenase